MGFFDRFKKPSYLGTTAAELGDDFDEVVRRLAKALLEQEPVISEVRDALVICRSPVLVIVKGEIRQPAALIPKPMLSRFWAEPGNECFDDPNLIPLVSGYAHALAANDKLGRAALHDTEDVYVDKQAPTHPWPDQDKRQRLASLVLADVARKLAANFNASEIKASYGLSPNTQAAQMRVATMKAEEEPWYLAALET